jgi:hypothetical protein
MRTFGVEEARQLVSHLVKTFTKVRGFLEEARALYAAKEQGKKTEAEVAPDLEALTEKIRAELMRLEEMGIEVKAVDGLVDFRAQRQGRPVFLCWRFGEETLSHWHELDAGFAGRQLIDDEAAFEKSFLC